MTKKINLALQGGGAHGAFTWGVLRAILRDPDLEIVGISGTSAGALNGAAVKAGLAVDEGDRGRELAIANLDWLWNQVGGIGDMRLSEWFKTALPEPSLISRAMEYSPIYQVTDAASRVISPYSYGPLYRHPLQKVVERLDFTQVCADCGPTLFVCTTRVRNGKIRVFTQDEITPAVLLASACLPTIFQAVEVFDSHTGAVEAFWDGGYTGNPALYPLFPKEFPDDIVIVNINPLERNEIPRTASEIQNRINEISFNSSLLRELRAINFVKRMIAEGRIERGPFADPRVHMIMDDDLMNDLSVATKLVPVPFILDQLREAGERAAEAFLANHKDDLNVRGTVDLKSMFD